MVVLELLDDDWLRVRAYATTGAWKPGEAFDEQRVFEYTTSAEWRDAKRLPTNARLHLVDGSAPERVEGAHDGAPSWIEIPDPAAIEPLAIWLASLPLRSAIQMYSNAPAADVTLGLRLSPKTVDVLADAWDRRPAGVLFWGDERVQRLLGRPRTAKPRIRIEASGIDWLSVSAEWEAEGERLTDADIARLRASKSRLVKLASGWVRRDATEQDEALTRALAVLGVEAGRPAERLTLWQLARAGEASLRALEDAGGDAETAQAIARLRDKAASFSGLRRVELPKGLRAELRPYQRDGLDFLAWTSSMELGAVLADDMGLGKTVQALAWLLHLRERDEQRGPALVVCPTSVLHNWAREAARFAPDLRVLVLAAGAERHDLRREVPEADLVLTTYALLRRDLDAWESTDLFAAILDEAQFVKNPDAAVSAAARKLRARHRLALTGTPLENRALDLWSILSFASPGVLGSRASFAARFDRADAPPHVRALLSAKLRPVFLRRLKSEVAKDLPDRIEERLDCELSDGQRKLYLAELARARDAVKSIAAEDADFRKSRIAVLALLTKLRQICCHPSLGGGKAALGSGKIDTLFELLEPLLAEGHKVLVYSQFVRFLTIVESELEARGVALHKLTGATTKRERVVAAFAQDDRPCVFLLSLKAGGTGLNLTAASYVVLLDPWWNPAVEAQAIDRSHRIGQDRTVIAYRLVTRGTVEEKIHELQQKKLALVRDVLGEDGFARALTRDDLDYLLADPEE
jgi:SNF2 family DNA or RNA helicase